MRGYSVTTRKIIAQTMYDRKEIFSLKETKLDVTNAM